MAARKRRPGETYKEYKENLKTEGLPEGKVLYSHLHGAMVKQRRTDREIMEKLGITSKKKYRKIMKRGRKELKEMTELATSIEE